MIYTKMKNSKCIIRNYNSRDLNNYIRFRIGVKQYESDECSLTAQSIKDALARPGYNPQSNLFIVIADKNIVGYIDIAIESSVGRAITTGIIHPNYRRMGLATQLFHLAEEHTRQLGLPVIQTSVDENDEYAQMVIQRLGLRPVHRFIEWRLDSSACHLCDNQSSNYLYRHLKQGEEPDLVHIQNHSFEGTWGYNPNTLDDIVYQLKQGARSIDDVIVVHRENSILGYCWIDRSLGVNHTIHTNKARILMLGIDPAHQGKGLGKKILIAALVFLKSKGIEVIEVTSDEENVAACKLYHSLGFKQVSATIWFEKKLDR